MRYLCPKNKSEKKSNKINIYIILINLLICTHREHCRLSFDVYIYLQRALTKHKNTVLEDWSHVYD